MATNGNTEPASWGFWLWRGALAFALVMGIVGHLEAIATLAAGSHATIGATTGSSPISEPQWQRIASLDPRGSAERAGLKVGDDVRYDGYLAARGFQRPGERIPVTVSREGQRFRTTLVAQPDISDRGALVGTTNLVAHCVGLIACALCALLLIRGGRARAPLLLAAVLMTISSAVPTLWAPAWLATGWLYFLDLLGGSIGLYCLARFCQAISGEPSGARTHRLVRWVALAVAAAALYANTSGLLTGPLPGAGAAMDSAVVVGGTGFAIWVMILNYRRADAATRNRIWIVGLAFASFALHAVDSYITHALAGAGELTAQLLWWGAVVFVLSTLLAVVLLVYAVLRQRLFDIRFAINRTLVYGTVSFIMLAGFGLAEWAADRLMPEAWHTESLLFSAGVAVVLFLSFHRLRDWIEKHVERLFFAGWQRAQADLKRFVASAGHFHQAPVLCREFAAEAERFAQGAPAALYLREDGGGFTREAGTLSAQERYAEEDRAFALLAAERGPVDLAEAHSALPAAMAFPMLDQLGLAGFVLLAPRPGGAHFRPDEIDNLAWATQQVGLDLQALQARELRAEVATLREQLAGSAKRQRRTAKTPQLTVAAAS